MKKILVLALATLTLCVSQTLYAAPALWQIDYQNKTSYLVGTIHATNPELRKSLNKLVPYVKKSRVFIAEINLADSQLQHAGQWMLEAASWSEGLPDDFYSAQESIKIANKLAEMGLPKQLMKRFEPWFLSLRLMILQAVNAGYDFTHSVDQALFEMAQKHQIPSKGLETSRQQIAFLDSFDEHGKSLLLDTIKQLDDIRLSMDAISAIWQSGDVQQLERLIDYSDKTYPSSRQVEERLLKQRNMRWISDLMPELAVGDAFIAVGLMHMAGPSSLLKGLTAEGAVITPVPLD
ncbi:TraB/GumN family protein [Gayadomonas joobiniege]|uniref:TraB/GumN family protein n=1 Tax=Gayadomonas joobiniege TaxID=1234606 RepID=UPI000371E027|nr:TraB/GumN family protein [Gayadomonas joobiniege]